MRIKSLLILGFVFLDRLVFADQCEDLACFIEDAQSLIEKGQYVQAIEKLKVAKQHFPNNREIVILLSVSYLNANNPIWAIKSLKERILDDPNDCEAKAWLAWTLIGLAQLDEAISVLEEHQGCSDEDMGRLFLLRSLVAKMNGDQSTAIKEITKVKHMKRLWDSDLSALKYLIKYISPSNQSELSWRVDLSSGYTSNALLGSPTDPASGDVKKGDTAFGQSDLWVRFSPLFFQWLNPDFEFQVKALGLVSPSVKDLSWIDVTTRVALAYQSKYFHLLLGWRPEFLVIAQGDKYDDGPVLYFSAHRGEFEVDLGKQLLIFGGAGARIFREKVRTRFEGDVGIGGNVGITRRINMLWAITARVYRANHPAWNLLGSSALLHMQNAIWKGFLMKTGATFSVDSYPDSSGYWRWGNSTEDRLDILVRPTISFWTPPWRGFRLALMYEFSWRHSSLPLFGFTDHRGMLRLQWAGETYLFVPTSSKGQPVADIPWYRDGYDQGLERIQDLLRQDETIQRSSSCVQ